MDALIAQTRDNGSRPTVIELARRLGLPNSTFWRHFPDLAEELRAAARASSPAPASATAARPDTPRHRVAALTRENEQLRAQLELAVANIARLSIDNKQLRDELHARSGIVSIAGHAVSTGAASAPRSTDDA